MPVAACPINGLPCDESYCSASGVEPTTVYRCLHRLRQQSAFEAAEGDWSAAELNQDEAPEGVRTRPRRDEVTREVDGSGYTVGEPPLTIDGDGRIEGYIVLPEPEAQTRAEVDEFVADLSDGTATQLEPTDYAAGSAEVLTLAHQQCRDELAYRRRLRAEANIRIRQLVAQESMLARQLRIWRQHVQGELAGATQPEPEPRPARAARPARGSRRRISMAGE